MELERIKDKIRKCLALAASPEPHEAAAALRQAQKLMSQHGISEDALDERPQGAATLATSTRKQRTPWEGILARAIADVFGIGVHWCMTRAVPVRGARRGIPAPHRGVTFYGDAARVELAHHAYVILQKAALKARAAYVRAHKAEHGWVEPHVGKSFLFGYAQAVAQAAVPLVPSPREQRALLEYKQQHGLVELPKRRVRYNPNHYGEGEAAGRAHGGLNVPVGSAGALRLLA